MRKKVKPIQEAPDIDTICTENFVREMSCREEVDGTDPHYSFFRLTNHPNTYYFHGTPEFYVDPDVSRHVSFQHEYNSIQRNPEDLLIVIDAHGGLDQRLFGERYSLTATGMSLIMGDLEVDHERSAHLIQPTPSTEELTFEEEQAEFNFLSLQRTIKSLAEETKKRGGRVMMIAASCNFEAANAFDFFDELGSHSVDVLFAVQPGLLVFANSNQTSQLIRYDKVPETGRFYVGNRDPLSGQKRDYRFQQQIRNIGVEIINLNLREGVVTTDDLRFLGRDPAKFEETVVTAYQFRQLKEEERVPKSKINREELVLGYMREMVDKTPWPIQHLTLKGLQRIVDDGNFKFSKKQLAEVNQLMTPNLERASASPYRKTKREPLGMTLGNLSRLRVTPEALSKVNSPEMYKPDVLVDRVRGVARHGRNKKIVQLENPSHPRGVGRDWKPYPSGFFSKKTHPDALRQMGG